MGVKWEDLSETVLQESLGEPMNNQGEERESNDVNKVVKRKKRKSSTPSVQESLGEPMNNEGEERERNDVNKMVKRRRKKSSTPSS